MVILPVAVGCDSALQLTGLSDSADHTPPELAEWLVGRWE